MPRNLKIQCRLVAMSMLASLLLFAGIIFSMGIPSGTKESTTFILFFVLNSAAISGLFFIKKWGFWLTYCALIIATYFKFLSYIPFTIEFPRQTNPVIFVYVIYLHYLYKKSVKSNNSRVT
jgi:hypothetical protein